MKLYGLLTLYWNSPSTQSLCLLMMYCAACLAVHVVALLTPEMSFGFTSPNMIWSFSVLMMCSRVIVRVFVSYCVSTVFTRQIMPLPGSSSSFSQSPTARVGALGPTVNDAVL